MHTRLGAPQPPERGAGHASCVCAHRRDGWLATCREALIGQSGAGGALQTTTASDVARQQALCASSPDERGEEGEETRERFLRLLRAP